MTDSIEKAVSRAIAAMHNNLGEELSVDDMARAAMFSKFHFTRIFQRVTGVSPGRFLSALRIQRAKQLLLSTSLNVADISLRVGYNSVGTFSSRFSRSVGLSPTAYRRLHGYALHIPSSEAAEGPPSARVRGVVKSGDEQDGLVFIGIFSGPVPEGQPVRCAILSEPGEFEFNDVPPASWYLLAQSERVGGGNPPDPTSQAIGPVSVATHGPLTIEHGADIHIDLTLMPARNLDPPVLLALLDARTLAFSRVRSISTTASSPSMVRPGLAAA